MKNILAIYSCYFNDPHPIIKIIGIAPEERITLMMLNMSILLRCLTQKLCIKLQPFKLKTDILYPELMILPILTTILAIILPPVVIFLAYTLSARSNKDREKATPFECGFEPKNKARIPFSTRFFLLAVIFLVFDIEIVLLIPTPISLNQIITFSSLIRAFLFLLILIVGLLHE